MCSELSLRGSYISAVYTHIHIHAYLCADQPLKRKRYFFHCTANKEIWHLVAIRRAVIIDIGFRDKWWSGRSLRESYIGSIHTLSHTSIFVRRSAINVTFCE